MQFINAFVFINDTPKRSVAVENGQRCWHQQDSKEEISSVFMKAGKKMERVTSNKGTLAFLFAAKPKVWCIFDQIWAQFRIKFQLASSQFTIDG
jgi:hypothetical protein